MKRTSLIVFLLGSCIYGSDTLEPDNVQNFLTFTKNLADEFKLSKPLRVAEGVIGNISDTYRYKNSLADVNYYAMHFKNLLRKDFSEFDIDILSQRITYIQQKIVSIGKRQGIELYAPSIIRVFDTHGSEFYRLDRDASSATKIPYSINGKNTREAILLSKADSIFNAGGSSISAFMEESLASVVKCFKGNELSYSLKIDLLFEKIHDFSEKGRLAQFIKVKQFKGDDFEKMDDIIKSLNDVDGILKKQDVLSRRTTLSL